MLYIHGLWNKHDIFGIHAKRFSNIEHPNFSPIERGMIRVKIKINEKTENPVNFHYRTKNQYFFK